MRSGTKREVDLAIERYRGDLIDTSTSVAIQAHITGDLQAHNLLGIPIAENIVQQEALEYGRLYREKLLTDGSSVINGKNIEWLDNQVEGTRLDVYDVIEQGLKEGKPVASIGGKHVASGTIAKDLEQLAIRDKQYEYVRIARTETARIQNQGAVNRYNKLNITHVNVIDNEGPNSCDDCAAVNGQVWTTEYASGHELEHPNCFIDPQIPIFTSTGWEQIGKISVGDLVLTHAGRFRKVTDTFHIPKQHTNVVKIGVGESLTTRRYITVTEDHPVMVNGVWKCAKDTTVNDSVSILSKKCKYCDTIIPWWRTSCSLACSSRVTMTRARQDPVWLAKSQTAQRKKMKELYEDPEYRKQITHSAHIKTREMVADGTHPFQQYENCVKANRALAQNKYGTYIEKKMAWLLGEMGLEYTLQQMIKRPERVKNNTGGGTRHRYYKPDFVLTEYDIIIECDGEYWHDPNNEYEIARQQYLEDMGYTVLRFGQSDILDNLSDCATTIRRVLMNHDHEYCFMQMPVASLERWSPNDRKTLYNLSVEEDESFIAKGFVVHNCVRTFSPVIPDEWEPPEEPEAVKIVKPNDVKISKGVTEALRVPKAKAPVSPRAPDAIKVDNLNDAEDAINDYTESLLKTDENHAEDLFNSLEDYTSENYDIINDALRFPDVFSESASSHKIAVESNIKNISEFLRGAPKFDGTVYRGMTFRDESTYRTLMNQMTASDSTMLKSFTSTSLDESIVRANFIDSVTTRKYSVVMEMRSKTGTYLGEMSICPEEAEVLFNLRTKFKIKSVKEVTSTSGRIMLEEII